MTSFGPHGSLDVQHDSRRSERGAEFSLNPPAGEVTNKNPGGNFINIISAWKEKKKDKDKDIKMTNEHKLTEQQNKEGNTKYGS